MESSMLKPVLPKFLYKKIEEDVVKLHIDLELEIPVDPYLVAKRLGYIVRRFSEITNSDALEILKSSSDESHDGLSYYDPTIGTYVIWINDLNTTIIQRLNFTIMHEVGHIRMDHRVSSTLAEMIANYYAAYALVPSPLPVIMKCDSVFGIMEEFNVSMDCAFHCLNRCRLWLIYGSPTKPYEKKLISYYNEKLN